MKNIEEQSNKDSHEFIVLTQISKTNPVNSNIKLRFADLSTSLTGKKNTHHPFRFNLIYSLL